MIGILGYFFQKVQEFMSDILSDIDFTVLYDWLPQDIQTAIAGLIIILIIFAGVKALRVFLPF